MLLSEKHAYRAQAAGSLSRMSSRDGMQHQRSREFSGASECLVVGNLCWREYLIFMVCFPETHSRPLTM